MTRYVTRTYVERVNAMHLGSKTVPVPACLASSVLYGVCIQGNFPAVILFITIIVLSFLKKATPQLLWGFPFMAATGATRCMHARGHHTQARVSLRCV